MKPEKFLNMGHFNSRPHKEVDGNPPGYRSTSPYFNSRPHKEVDWNARNTDIEKEISIHDLTRRSTLQDLRLALICSHFNSRPHKEVDCTSY